LEVGGAEVDNGCSVDAYVVVELLGDEDSDLVEEDTEVVDNLDHPVPLDMDVGHEVMPCSETPTLNHEAEGGLRRQLACFQHAEAYPGASADSMGYPGEHKDEAASSTEGGQGA
jgi:hypothetical protein